MTTSQAPAGAAPVRTTIRNVRVFDGSGLTAATEVVIDGGLITSVGTPGSGPVLGHAVDGAGAALLPGLIDCHLHLDGRADLELCARWGVTTVCDMGTRDVRVLDAMRALPGLPTVLLAGVPASAPGGQHVAKMGFPADSAVPDAAHAARFVADQVAAGSDFIKIIVEDPKVPGTKALPAPTLAALVIAAHEAGRLVVAHAVTRAAVRLAVDAAVDVITHAPLDGVLADDLVARLADRGTVLVPTLTMMRGVVDHLNAKMAMKILSGLRIAPRLDYAHAERTVTAFHRAGATVLAGTDANHEPLVPARPPHGESLHDELARLVAGGLSPNEALRAATVMPATVFGLADRGAVAPGQRADLVLVRGDPTRDITATRNVLATWIGGISNGSAAVL